LEPRVLLNGTSVTVPLDPTLDQFGDQIPTVQAISAKSGTLTTRVDADTAILTLASGHGITNSDTVDVYWDDGRRNGLTVTAYDGATITIDAGVGDGFPAQGTAITCGSSSLGGSAFVDFSIFDTGASVVTFSADFQALAEFLGDPIPIKVPGGATAEGIGGWIQGDVSQPGTILAGGMNAMSLTFDKDGFPEFKIDLGTTGAATPGIQAFVGTNEGSPGLVTITGTPFLNASLANPNGLAAFVDMRGYLMDFSDLIPGLTLAMPDIRFVSPGTPPVPTAETTAVVYVPLGFFGFDNHLDPGNQITESFNPVQGQVGLANSTAGRSLEDQNFLFDTGAQLSVISTDAALGLGLNLANPEWTIDVSGVGGTVNVPGFTLSELTLPTTDGGLVTFTDVPVHVLDIGYGIDGILGMNLFNTAASVVYDPFHPSGPRLGLTFYIDPDRGIGELDPTTLQFLESLGLTFAAATVGHRLPGFGVDSQDPAVVAINRSGSTPTGATTAQFAVTFSEEVTGVDAADFTLALSGATGTLDSVSGTGATYTVTVKDVGGNGTLGLNLVDDDSVVDGAGNKLGGTGAGNGNFTGQTYTIDTTVPSVTIGRADGQADPTSQTTILFTVVFSETVTGFTKDDVDLSQSTAPGTLVAEVTGQGNQYQVAVSGMTGTGAVIATIPAGAAQDDAGNVSSVSSSPVDKSVWYYVPFADHFDFGTKKSPKGQGYLRVTDNTRYSSALGYGWQSGKIYSADRGKKFSDLLRDLNYTLRGTFAVDLPNGLYEVEVAVGDCGPVPRGPMGIIFEGVQVDTVTTPKKTVVTRVYTPIVVSDGELTMRLQGLGGKNKYTAIEYLRISPLGPGSFLAAGALNAAANESSAQDGLWAASLLPSGPSPADLGLKSPVAPMSRPVADPASAGRVFSAPGPEPGSYQDLFAVRRDPIAPILPTKSASKPTAAAPAGEPAKVGREAMRTALHLRALDAVLADLGGTNG
jgi:hypothetical protein